MCICNGIFWYSNHLGSVRIVRCFFSDIITTHSVPLMKLIQIILCIVTDHLQQTPLISYYKRKAYYLNNALCSSDDLRKENFCRQQTRTRLKLIIFCMKKCVNKYLLNIHVKNKCANSLSQILRLFFNKIM